MILWNNWFQGPFGGKRMTNPKNFGGHQDGDKKSLGRSPKYRAYHEVYITKDLGSQRNQAVIAFIDKHIAEFRGKTEAKHGISVMIFERKADAAKFAKEMSSKLNIPKEHIEVKAQKFTR
jgi:hypothetical protein